MKKFIPLLVIPILVFLNSCSKDDDMFINSNDQKEVENSLLNKKILDKNDQFIFKTIAKDSIFKENSLQNVEPEQSENDPPVKNGDHWVYGN